MRRKGRNQENKKKGETVRKKDERMREILQERSKEEERLRERERW